MRIFFLFIFIILFPAITFAESKFILNSTKIIEGLGELAVARFPPDRSIKFLLAQKQGRLFWVDRESKSSTLFFDLPGETRKLKIVDLLFHYDYTNNGRIFIAFLEFFDQNTDLVVQEFSSNEESKLSMYKEVLRLRQPDPGQKDFSIAFDEQGNLLIALPDGAENFDPKNQAQDKDLLWGKVIRFNIKEAEYTAPIDNPFVMEKTGKKEIYARGFREPADMFYDANTKILLITDRGADTFQELNILKAAGNYGWSYYESSQCLRMQMECSAVRTEKPLLEYSFKLGKKIVISPIYRGNKNHQVREYMFIYDGITGQTWLAKMLKDFKLEKSNISMKDPSLRFENFFTDSEGELYSVSRDAIYSLSIDSL